MTAETPPCVSGCGEPVPMDGMKCHNCEQAVAP